MVYGSFLLVTCLLLVISFSYQFDIGAVNVYCEGDFSCC